MAGKMHVADSGLSFSLGTLLYNPKERGVPPTHTLFLLWSFYSQDICHLFINKKKKKERMKGREEGKESKNHLT